MSADTSRRRTRVVRGVPGAALAIALLGSAVVAAPGSGLVLTGGAKKLPPPDAVVETAPSTLLASTAADSAESGNLREERLTGPDRVVVRDDLGIVATFTLGARTVSLRGPGRVFTESTTTATVTTNVWVRLLDRPFQGTVDHAWLAARLEDTSDDILEVARQYTTGAPDRWNAAGTRIAGDASYGPLLADGTREEGSDFNDYLGLSWSYGSEVDRPEARQIGALDCSGYVRVVFGYRGGVPMTLQPDGRALPRRAVQMSDSAPGVVVIPNTGSRPSSSSSLSPGDLVFFDASADDGSLVDHVGIYLGIDSAGAPRFVSSRKSADGPTMGDVRGRSTLAGTGLYATAFRSARRL